MSNKADLDPNRTGRTDHPTSRLQQMRSRLAAHRARVRRSPMLNLTYRIVLGTVGGLILLGGIVLIPYPGPGWLVVFVGLGILATEFTWAHQVNMFAKRHYRRWTAWVSRQPLAIKLAVMAGTGLIVLLTLWLLGVFGTVCGWFGLRWAWLTSPLFGH